VLIFIGLWGRLTYCAGFLLLIALTFGSTLRQVFREHNVYSMDGARTKANRVNALDGGGEMTKFSPTNLHGDCEDIANPSTAFGRRRRNWIDAHGAVPAGQVVDARCGNEHCIALRHAHVRPRVEQPGKYRKVAARVHRLKVGQHFDVPGIGIDERSRNRFRSGLYAVARLDKVSVRGQPDGSVRVTKVGVWSSVRS
jgi:hypothetical protein